MAVFEAPAAPRLEACAVYVRHLDETDSRHRPGTLSLNSSLFKVGLTKKLGIEVKIWNIDYPKVGAEEHYYNPKR